MEQHTWCNSYFSNGASDLDQGQLFWLATGRCIVGTPCTLESADSIILLQQFPKSLFSRLDSPRGALVANRLSVFQKTDGEWRLKHRESHIGGKDLDRPLHFAQTEMGWIPAMIFGGGTEFGSHEVGDTRSVDVNPWWTVWGLDIPSGQGIAEADKRTVARHILADASIPPEAAAIQFLASYASSGGWDEKDLGIADAIFSNPRVTEFGNYGDQVPPALVQPIAQRMLNTSLAPSLSVGQLGKNRSIVETMAHFIARMGSCATASIRDIVRQADGDSVRAPLVKEAVKMVAYDEKDCRAQKP